MIASTFAGIRTTEPPRWLALPLALSGVLVAAGAIAPWLTLFAGLRRLPGVSGLFGQLVLAGGIVLTGGAIWFAWRGGRSLAAVLVLLAVVLAGFCVWLVPRQYAVRERLLAEAMVVPAIGPGVFIALAGALLAVIAAIGAWKSTSLRRRPSPRHH